MKNEKDVKKQVKKLLDQYNYFWFMPPSNAYGKAGISDIIALGQGVFLAIETKFGSNKPTALQIGFLNSIRAEKGFAFVVNDKNIDWLEAWLAAFKRGADAISKQQMPADEDGAMMINAIRELTDY